MAEQRVIRETLEEALPLSLVKKYLQITWEEDDEQIQFYIRANYGEALGALSWEDDPFSYEEGDISAPFIRDIAKRAIVAGVDKDLDRSASGRQRGDPNTHFQLLKDLQR